MAEEAAPAEEAKPAKKAAAAPTAPAAKKKLPKGRHLSQIKRERQNIKRHARNVTLRSEVKTYIKKVKDAVIQKDKKLASDLLRQASRVIQQTASKGVLHARNASRKISRLATMVSGM